MISPSESSLTPLIVIAAAAMLLCNYGNFNQIVSIRKLRYRNCEKVCLGPTEAFTATASWVKSMKKVALFLTGLVAIEHLVILVIEMFFWDHPFGRKTFGMTPEVSSASAVLAMNQGLYNGFLAAGLIWGILSGRKEIKVFFLVCVVTAGIFGGLTAKTSILLTQGLPALVALIFVLLSSQERTSTKTDS